MNSLLKKVAAVTLVALTFSGMAFAAEPYCIRVYCKKDTSTKLMKWTGSPNARLFPALFDEKTNKYLISEKNWQDHHKKDCVESQQLWGTNAATLEILSSFYAVDRVPAKDHKPLPGFPQDPQGTIYINPFSCQGVN